MHNSLVGGRELFFDMPEYPSIHSGLRHRFCSRTGATVYAVAYLVSDSLSSPHYCHGILDMFKGSLEGIPNFGQNMGLSYRHFTPPKPI